MRYVHVYEPCSAPNRCTLLRVVHISGAHHDEGYRHQDGSGSRAGQDLVQCRQSVWQESSQLHQRVSIVHIYLSMVIGIYFLYLSLSLSIVYV
jgi:hypothetical protein